MSEELVHPKYADASEFNQSNTGNYFINNRGKKIHFRCNANMPADQQKYVCFWLHGYA